MTFNAKQHWEGVYQAKKSDEVSWYQRTPQTSLDLINELCLDKNSAIIDVGAGDSTLVDTLFARGFRNITLLDVSETALGRTRKRLGKQANLVKWVACELSEFETKDQYDLWHDRAVLHFMTEEKDIYKYVESARRFLKPNGYLIVSVFSTNGPRKCSGLDIKQYSEASLKNLFHDFEYIKSFEKEHITPFGTSQMFIHGIFRKGD